MGALTRFLFGESAEELRADTLADPSSFMFGAFGAERTASGKQVGPVNALQMADVYACIRVLSDAAGSIPIITYRETDQGRERADDTLIAKLLRQPAPYMTQSNFISAIVAHMNTYGEAFIGKTRGNGMLVDELLLINPTRVVVHLEEGEPIFRVTPSANVDQNQGVFTRQDIIHVKGLSWDGIRGMSPIRQARDAIGTGMALEDWAGRSVDRGFNPQSALQMDGELSDNAIRRVRKSFKEALVRSRNDGGWPVLEYGLKPVSLQIPQRDAQFIEQRKFSSTQIARIFRIPPYMIAADGPNTMTYSNVESEAIHFVTWSLRPWLVAIEQAFKSDADLFGEETDLYPEFLIDALLRADTLSRYEAYQKALGSAAWMTVNEPRERENLDKLPGGDTLPLERPGMSTSGGLIPVNVEGNVPTNEPVGTNVSASASNVVPLKRSLDEQPEQLALPPTPQPIIIMVNGDHAAEDRAIQRGEQHQRSLMEASRAIAELASREQNVNVFVEPAQVKVPPPDVNVNVEPAQIEITVPPSDRKKPGKIRVKRDAQNLPVEYTVEDEDEVSS